MLVLSWALKPSKKEWTKAEIHQFCSSLMGNQTIHQLAEKLKLSQS
jgi:hypothetical protein